MTNTETGSMDPAVLEELNRVFIKVDKWRERTQTPFPEPEPGSILAGDDATLDPYQLSHAAWVALGTAVDHVHALRSLIAANILHTFAPFTLLRAALENAATVVWLLAPSAHDQRVLRRLRLKWADVCDHMRARELMGHPVEIPRQKHLTRLKGIARNNGLSQEQIAGVTASPIGFGKIVEEAAAAAPMFVDPRRVGATWMACSGITHGRPWPQKLVLDLVETSAPVNGIHSLRATASDTHLLAATQTATSMIGYGWYLFDNKRKSPVPPSE